MSPSFIVSPKLKTLVRVESTTVRGGKTATQTRWYVTLPPQRVERMASGIRHPKTRRGRLPWEGPPPLVVSPLAAGPPQAHRRRNGSPRRNVRGGKSASGGLRWYHGPSVFEKRCGTRQSAPRGWEMRWGAALSQTETTKSWAGTETKVTTTEHDGNSTTTTTRTTGDSASGTSVVLRGNAGSETATTTENKHGVFSTVTTETHKEGILEGSGGASKKGLEVGGATTAIEHGKTWTGKLTFGKLTINLPGVGLSYGIGAGAKVSLGKGPEGRVGLSVKASVGESLSLRILPFSFSWNSSGGKK